MNIDIAVMRLAAQRLTSRQFDKPADTVRWMGAMQAQDYGQAVWGVGVRTSSATLESVEAAIEAGEILRTWPMRGTIHFVPAGDAQWMLQLGAARKIAADTRRMGQLDLDDKIIERCGVILQAALQGGKSLSRPDALQTLEDKGIGTKNGRGYHILWRLSQSGLLCIGPTRAKQQTFVILDEWAPPNKHDVSREEALAMLAERYFRSHGPATIQDFAWWSGLNQGDCKKGVQGAGSTLTSTIIAGKEYWHGVGLTKLLDEAAIAAARQTFLLPAFDEYFLGYKDRSDVMDLAHAEKVVPGGNGVIKPTIVSGGQIIGVWQRKINKKTVGITAESFLPAVELTNAIQPASQSYARFQNVA
jgi:hypothetical protein